MSTISKQVREQILAGATEPISIDGSIDLSGTELKEIACPITCNDLNLSGTAIQELSSKVKVRSRLSLDNCKKLERLPVGLTCGSLSVRVVLS